jgi:hypothetical protein
MNGPHWHHETQTIGGGHLTQPLASGTAFCADTSAALAIVSVSARKKFCFTQLSRERRNAGASRRTNGSKPVFVASATSTGANAGRDVLGSRTALARVGEKVGESGSRVHLKHQFRQIEPGKARIARRAEPQPGSAARQFSPGAQLRGPGHWAW